MSHVLRQAAPSDAAAITRLVRAAYEPAVALVGGEPRPMHDDYSALVVDPGVVVVVAEVDGQPAGVVVFRTDAPEALVDNVAVGPDFQGRGLGRLLLDHAEAAAAEQGCATVRLFTHERMTDNISRYTRRGYVEYAREPLPDGSALVHMRMALG